jgi:flagellar biosynthesis GTPase FlhF
MCITQINKFTASEQVAWDAVSKGRNDGSDNPPEPTATEEKELMKGFIKTRISDDLRCKVHNDTMNRRRIQRKMIVRASAGGVVNANLSGKFVNSNITIRTGACITGHLDSDARGVGSGSGTFDEPGLANVSSKTPQNDPESSDDDLLNVWKPGRSQYSGKKSQDSSKKSQDSSKRSLYSSKKSKKSQDSSKRSLCSSKKSQDSSKRSEDTSMQEEPRQQQEQEPRQQQEEPRQRRQRTSEHSQTYAVRNKNAPTPKPLRKSARKRKRFRK